MALFNIKKNAYDARVADIIEQAQLLRSDMQLEVSALGSRIADIQSNLLELGKFFKMGA